MSSIITLHDKTMLLVSMPTLSDQVLDVGVVVRRRAEVLSTTIPEDQQELNYKLLRPVIEDSVSSTQARIFNSSYRAHFFLEIAITTEQRLAYQCYAAIVSYSTGNTYRARDHSTEITNGQLRSHNAFARSI